MDDKIFYTTVFISLLIAVIIVFFVVSIILYHRRYMQLQRERIVAEITILENERKRIAADLHDSMGPLLSTIKLNINSVQVNDEHDKMVIAKSGTYIDDVIRGLRQISHNLLPATLERKGLVDALHEFIRQVSVKAQLDIRFHTSGQISIPPEKEIHVFRIIQEITHNTLKHAKATQLQIVLSREDGFFLVLVKENGVGFDVGRVKAESTGLGMKSLAIRTDILNGSLVIESVLGQGTNYFIKIPVG
ncbi:sensor histidine kinase [Chitinophaga sancti]|uniref:Histidine kinase n=1 Tax=Chitinophaga sancti TaxID=1004 RepID=A0A1K1M8A9_9BACT|nr:ATP-binding protein [Chitinophaga sancti]WQD64560.1 histidine kinase [Chitinophaga sancti]WQG89815.1 histidine kinase [Chitinophaga sancti]SFW19380.1 Histidine kinase-, DNA gyrase B-, and HSP90-like ATPase [Chitinophaga sancti]